ncbi:MAG TPA: sigma-54-dependent Fis family transcriptional regulator [Desulfonatronum sp.]|nr:sigma-54-dependent Fis family transcriptional regulator [Desulfonatronum sp.]
MAHVLIIDDDQVICTVLSKKIARLGHQVQVAHTMRAGLELAGSNDFDVIFLDVRLPDGNGLDALPAINQGNLPPEVIIITGESDPDGAELAIRNGAWDYVQKPSSLKSMVFPLIRALQYREKKKVSSSKKALQISNIIGASPRIRACLDLLAQAADSDMSVLVTGETGTGKELFARAIHVNSSRAQSPFVTVDCASLPENLVESELFGSIKGAFTGATATREGLIIKAHGGTLFLDEVGELPLTVQKKFLRVLQEHRFRQVGGTREISSDFRLVCATNQDLESMIRAGVFRQDLLYRLKSMSIELPPLRDRREDLKGLAIHRMTTICEHYKIPTKGMSREFVEALLNYDWPGNVRELYNVLDNVLLSSRDEPILYPQHLPLNLRIKAKRASLGQQARSDSQDQSPPRETFEESLEGDARFDPAQPPRDAAPQAPGSVQAAPGAPADIDDQAFPTLRDVREKTISAMEEEYLQKLLRRSGSDLAAALRLSGLSRARFYELLKKHSISLR